MDHNAVTVLTATPEQLAAREQLRRFMAALIEVGSAPHLEPEQRAALWACAFDEWLRANPRTGRPRPPKTIAAYTAAWLDFRLVVDKAPWQVTGADVKRWLADMTARALTPHVADGLIAAGRRRDHIGLSEATQAQYLAAVSSFFAYCERYPVGTRPDGAEVYLHDGNPARAQGVPQPRPRPYGEAAYLDVAQLRALLRAVGDWAKSRPANHLPGVRDYALFLTYALTGGRSAEIRTLRWQDLRHQAAGVYYHWQNKGKDGWDELAAPAWDAIRTYLQLANRFASIQPGDPIFVATPAAARRFGHAAAERNAPLSSRQVNNLLKRYADLAGLDAARIKTHTLRHSAYMLYSAAGSDLRFCSRLLHHSSLAVTSLYDHALAGQENAEWAKAWSLLDLRPMTFRTTEPRP